MQCTEWAFSKKGTIDLEKIAKVKKAAVLPTKARSKLALALDETTLNRLRARPRAFSDEGQDSLRISSAASASDNSDSVGNGNKCNHEPKLSKFLSDSAQHLSKYCAGNRADFLDNARQKRLCTLDASAGS